MKRIRKEKDIQIRWTVLTNGEPETLEGRDLRLFIRMPFGHMVRHPFYIEQEYTIVLWFKKEEQIYLGRHGLTLVERYGDKMHTVLDVCDAFELVSHTCRETEPDTVTLDTESINVGVHGPQGFSPIVEPAEDNTPDRYRLHIITEEEDYYTENLKVVPVVCEYDGYLKFPTVGKQGMIYVDTNENKAYRWSVKMLRYECIGTDYNDVTIIDSGTAWGLKNSRAQRPDSMPAKEPVIAVPDQGPGKE